MLASDSRGVVRIEGDVVLSIEEGDEEQPGQRKRRLALDVSEGHPDQVERYERRKSFSQSQTERQGSESDITPEKQNSLNPWLIAKMTAPVLGTHIQHTVVTEGKSNAEQPAQPFLPTPLQSSEPHSPSQDISERSIAAARPRNLIHIVDIRSFVIPRPSHNHPQQHDDPTEPCMNSRSLTSEEENGPLLSEEDFGTIRPRNDFVSARNLLLLPEDPVPQIIKPSKALNKSQRLSKPALSRIANAANAVLQNGVGQTRMVDDLQLHCGQRGHGQDGTERDVDSELAWAMDFEQRKETATRRRREELQAARKEMDVPNGEGARKPSPHKNRYKAAIAALETRQLSAQDNTTLRGKFRTMLAEGDPRAYLMRRQKSMQAQGVQTGVHPKMTRAKSTRLPLEVVPEQDKVHMLMLNSSVDILRVRRITSQLTKVDGYVGRGHLTRGLEITPSETKIVEVRVQAAVEMWLAALSETPPEVEYMFQNLLDVQ